MHHNVLLAYFTTTLQPALCVMPDAGYDIAKQCAKEQKLDLPMLNEELSPLMSGENMLNLLLKPGLRPA